MYQSNADELLLHTLGLRQKDDPYRNHFIACPGHHDLPKLEELERGGFMERAEFHFRATDLGKARALSLVAKRNAALSRSQKRYRRWLEADYADLSFGDWLKQGCP